MEKDIAFLTQQKTSYQKIRRTFSFIQTFTVGFGFSPNLLTLRLGRKRSWACLQNLPPVGTFTLP